LNPLINILIRTHRPALFKNAFNSVIGCGYDNIVTHIYEDKNYQGDRSIPFFYNLFCNDLKSNVSDGYFLFLDDDDRIIRGSLNQVAPFLNEDQPLICQMLRNGKKKPADIYMDKGGVIKGRIGMPCLILHSKHRYMHEFRATEDADYQWIKTVSEQLPCRFVKIPVVDAGERRFGQ